MRGGMPSIHCDHEDGCSEWTIDYYELTADNWRDLMAGWAYDPHRSPETAYCPKHAGAA